MLEFEDTIPAEIAGLIEEIRKFNKDRNWDQFHSIPNLAKAISVESNELLADFFGKTLQIEMDIKNV